MQLHASMLQTASCAFTKRPRLPYTPFDFNLSGFLSEAYLQPAAAEARQDEKVERDEPEAHQRERRGIALQEFFEVDALDVVLRLLRDF